MGSWEELNVLVSWRARKTGIAEENVKAISGKTRTEESREVLTRSFYGPCQSSF